MHTVSSLEPLRSSPDGSRVALMTPVLSVLAVSWMFLGPALITRTVFWFVAGHSHQSCNSADADGVLQM